MKSSLGLGIYTISDAAEILQINKSQIRYWFNRYVDREFRSGNFDDGYFYEEGKVIAVNFYTLIETYVFYHLKNKGVPTKRIIEAHKVLSEQYSTPYPFALKDFLCSGADLFQNVNGDIISLDKRRQLAISQIILHFSENIDFSTRFASKYYPRGRENSVVINPSNQFGSPIIDGTNIKIATIKSLFDGGEKVDFIAKIYELDKNQVEDAIKYAA